MPHCRLLSKSSMPPLTSISKTSKVLTFVRPLTQYSFLKIGQSPERHPPTTTPPLSSLKWSYFSFAQNDTLTNSSTFFCISSMLNSEGSPLELVCFDFPDGSEELLDFCLGPVSVDLNTIDLNNFGYILGRYFSSFWVSKITSKNEALLCKCPASQNGTIELQLWPKI